MKLNNIFAKTFVILCLTVLPVLSLTGCKETVPDTGQKTETTTVEKAEQETTATEAKEPVLTGINRYVLDPAEQCYVTKSKMKAYKKAMKALFAHKSKVRLTDSYDDNLSVMGYLQMNPYTFILSEFDITSDHKSMYFKYKYSAEECKEMVDFIDREYLTLINENITSDMTELEKVLAIHRYFAERIEYDYDWAEALDMADDKYAVPDIVIYQALKTNKGVCHTYTYLCQFAFQQLGIECIRASAGMQDSDASHMWPIVRIDGVSYHIDPTWDRNGEEVSLQYFGMTDEENIERGLVDDWSIGIDVALDVSCQDSRFAVWRDFVDYKLIGHHQMEATRSDGSTEIVDLTRF